jgi:hypothetical protein
MIAIIGSREITQKMQDDIKHLTKKLLDKRKLVVTGGAFGTDFEVIKTVFENKKLNQLTVILPQGINGQISYYQEKGNTIAARKIKYLFTTIVRKRPKVFQSIEKEYNPKTYGQCCLKRNASILQIVNKCCVFQNLASDSENNPSRPSGTQHVLYLAEKYAVNVTLKQYGY